MFTNKKENSRIFLYQTFKSNTPKSKKKIKIIIITLKHPKDVAKNW